VKAEDIGAKIDFLVSAWCSRKELVPLRHILNGAASINGLTDGWAALLEALQTIRAQCKERITEQELDAVIELQHEMNHYVYR